MVSLLISIVVTTVKSVYLYKWKLPLLRRGHPYYLITKSTDWARVYGLRAYGSSPKP